MRAIQWDPDKALDMQRALEAITRTLLDGVLPDLRQLHDNVTGDGRRYPSEVDRQLSLIVRNVQEQYDRLKRLARNLETANQLIQQAEGQIALLFDRICFGTLIGGSSLSSVFAMSSFDAYPLPAAAGDLPRISDMIVLDWLEDLASRP